jgi:hypothetical protein
MARIVWSRAEREIINDRLFKLYCIKGDLPRKYALSMAQEALPAERRVVITDQRVFNSKMALEQAQTQAVKFNRRAPEKAPEKPSEPAAPISIPTPAPEARSDPTGRLAGALEALLDAIADRVADRVAERVLLQLPEHMPQRVPPAVIVPQSAIGSGKARPGVWLLGVQSAMGFQLRDKYRERLDIEYLDSDEAARRTPSPRAHIVMMTRFVSHSVQERWKKYGRFHFCNGGLTALEGVLDSL